jgi:hypothetical protein
MVLPMFVNDIFFFSCNKTGDQVIHPGGLPSLTPPDEKVVMK